MRKINILLAVVVSLVVGLDCHKVQAKTLQTGLNLTIKSLKKEEAGLLISIPDPFSQKMHDTIVLENIVSVKDYGKWLQNHLYYQREAPGQDIWSLPGDTLSRNGGDCEDLAFFTQAVLEVLGYKPQVLCLLRPAESHALCVFKDDGRYYIVDNTNIFETTISSRLKLFEFLAKKYNATYIAQTKLETKNYDILFQKENIASDDLHK
jgi:Transglutaminase-like domain